MSEIPKEIMKAAEQAALLVIRNGEVSAGTKTIARAILAERERCAKVAFERRLSDHPRLSAGSEINAWWSGQEVAASEIVDAIRKGATE